MIKKLIKGIKSIYTTFRPTEEQQAYNDAYDTEVIKLAKEQGKKDAQEKYKKVKK